MATPFQGKERPGIATSSLGSQGKTDDALAAYARAERLDPQLFWIPY